MAAVRRLPDRPGAVRYCPEVATTADDAAEYRAFARQEARGRSPAYEALAESGGAGLARDHQEHAGEGWQVLLAFSLPCQ